MEVESNAVNVTTYFYLRKTSDNTAATVAGGLTLIEIDLQYTRSGAEPTAKVNATALASASEAHMDNEVFEIDATDQPGLYRVDWPDAAFVYGLGVREVILTVKEATVYTEHLRVTIGKAGFNALLVTTVATTPSVTTITPTRKPGDANSLLNAVIVFRDGDGDPSFRTITAWDGTTITYVEADFVVAIGDQIEIYPAAVAATADDIRDAILDRVMSGNHDVADTPGGVLQTLTAIAARTNNSNLNALLGVTDTAAFDIKKELLNLAITGEVSDSIMERVKTIDDANIPGRLPGALVGARMDSDLGGIVNDAVAAAQLSRWAKNGLLSGTADSGSTTTVIDTALTEEDGAYVGGTIVFQAGGSANNIRLARLITGFVASTDTLTFHPAVTTGITTESYHIIPSGGVNVEAVNNDTDAADKLAAHSLEALPVTFSAGGSTTTAVLNLVDGAGASSTNDKYNGRILLFNNGTLDHEIAEITAYVGATLTATISAVTAAPDATHTARLV